MAEFLKLNKGGFLNLSKNENTLEHIRVAVGWNVSNGFFNYDLDLIAQLVHSNGKIETISFANKTGTGINLDKDNLTGAGNDDDDENINIYFNKLKETINKINIFVNIYVAKFKFGQNFSKVKNSYVRIINENEKREICRFEMSKDEGKHTSIKAGTFEKKGNEWIFTAVGEYGNLNLTDIEKGKGI